LTARALEQIKLSVNTLCSDMAQLVEHSVQLVDVKVSEIDPRCGDLKNIRFSTEKMSELYNLKCASNVISLCR
jgi:hypothetical protein